MTATSGTSPQSLIPITTTPGDNSRTPVPAHSEDSSSFKDVLQQHEGPTSKPDIKAPAASPNVSNTASAKPKTDASTDPKSNLAKTPATPAITAAATSSTSAPAPTPATGLIAMLVQAKVQPANTPAPTSATDDGANPPSTTAKGTTPSSSTPSNADVTSPMLLRLALFASQAQAVIVPKSTAAPVPASKTADPQKDSTAISSQQPSGSSDLSTLMIQALILASNAQQNAASAPSSTPSSAPIPSAASPTTSSTTTSAAATTQAAASGTAAALASAIAATDAASTAAATTTITTTIAGKNLPILDQTQGTIASPAKEKKSDNPTAKGSFLQASSTASSTDFTSDGPLGSDSTTVAQLTAVQPVTPATTNKNSSSIDLASPTSSIAGTANVEKGKAMNADLNIPQLAAISNLGAQATPTRQTPADVNILLSSNNDFQDALKQVMHVAQLTQTSESRTPMRVAIEIQTPPGAIVNVYVSRQNDQWRAQLSTNDPQALTWVQDKMNSIRSGDVGVDVKWLPPQLETSSGGTSSNPGWERGGQNQSNYQQPDERSQSQRQKRTAAEPELTTVGVDDFMDTLTAIAGAA